MQSQLRLLLQLLLFVLSALFVRCRAVNDTSDKLCQLKTGQQPRNGVKMHKVQIHPSNIICKYNSTSPAQCPAGIMFPNYPQLMPLNLTVHDVIVPLITNSNQNTSILFKQVEEALFLSCNVSDTSSYDLENATYFQFNRSGMYYFIATKPLNGCESGLRFSVKVREEDCMYSNDDETFCSGHGNCIIDNTDDSYTCQCCAGYIGRYCQEFDGCYNDPCENSGLCVDITEGLDGDTFQCLCPFGFKGRVCQQPFDPCDSSPCFNNGSCKTIGSSYECKCPEHFSGTSCQNEPDPCTSNPCVHGICKIEDQNYRCYCYQGFGGTNCEFQYNECDSGPCMNGGICEDGIASYNCRCLPGFRGKNCHIREDLCASDPCTFNMICTSRGDHYTCSCPEGYTGENCEIKYDPCEPSPCVNSGTCWKKYGGFYCACKPGFTGEKCEETEAMHQIPGGIIERGGVNEYGDGVLQRGHINMSDVHNVYIATGTLLGAVIVVLTVVAVCHCLYRKPYQQFGGNSISNLLGGGGGGKSNLPRVTSSSSLFQKRKGKKKLSCKDSTVDSIYDATSREICVETLDIPLISSIKCDERI